MNIRNVFLIGRNSIQSLFIIVIICMIGAQQAMAINVVSPVNQESFFSAPSFFNEYEMAYVLDIGNGTDIVAIAYNGSDAGVTVTDGTSTASINFSSVPFLSSFIPPFLPPTEFSKPDIALRWVGTNLVKAIVTVDTNAGSYVAEFDITTGGSLAINPTPGGLADPIPSLGILPTSGARLDLDISTANFVVLTSEGDDLYYSVYQPAGTSYSPLFANNLANSVSTPGLKHFGADIALSYENVNQPVIVVSYRRYDTNSFGPSVDLNVDEIRPFTAPVPTSVYFSSLIMPGGLPLYWASSETKIAGENNLGGVQPSSPMKWALTMADWNNIISVPSHLFYLHSSMGSSATPWLLDAPFVVTTPGWFPIAMSYGASIEWMPDLGIDDAVVVFDSAFAAGTAFTGIASGVMAPFNSGTPNGDWHQFNLALDPTSIDSARTSVSSDPSSGRYTISYLSTNGVVGYRIMPIGDANF